MFIRPLGHRATQVALGGQNAIQVDAPSGNYLEGGATRWAPADNANLSIVSWLKFGDVANITVFGEDHFSTLINIFIRAEWDASLPVNTMSITLEDGGGDILNMQTLGFGTHGLTTNTWFPFFFSTRHTASPVVRTWFGNTNVFQTPSAGPTANRVINLNDAVKPFLGVNKNAANGVYELSSIWIDDSYIDFDVEANRELFMTAAGLPKHLGSQGEIPTGSQCLHYNPNGDLTDNFGSEANWVEVGTVSTVDGPAA
jgi:hypothetical protein